MSARARRGLAGLAALLLAAICGGYYLEGTPQYSLYRFAVAIHGRDMAAAERFVDVDRVAQAASDVVVAEYLGRNSRGSHGVETLAQGTVRTAAGQVLKPLVTARVREEIRKAAGNGGAGTSALLLPAGIVAAFRQLDVSREGSGAWVVYREPRGRQSRFRVTQQPDRTWKITELDPEWVRRHLKGS